MKKSVKNKFYEVGEDGNVTLIPNVTLFKEFAVYILRESLNANGLRYSRKGKKRLFYMWKNYYKNNLSDDMIATMIAEELIKKDHYNHQQPGRQLNNRNLKFIRFKLKLHLLDAIKSTHKLNYYDRDKAKEM